MATPAVFLAYRLLQSVQALVPVRPARRQAAVHGRKRAAPQRQARHAVHRLQTRVSRTLPYLTEPCYFSKPVVDDRRAAVVRGRLIIRRRVDERRVFHLPVDECPLMNGVVIRGQVDERWLLMLVDYLLCLVAV